MTQEEIILKKIFMQNGYAEATTKKQNGFVYIQSREMRICRIEKVHRNVNICLHI